MVSKNIRIMLIEDDSGDRRLFQEALTDSVSEKLELVYEESLQEGLHALADSRFDILFLDLNLPDSNGLETLNTALASTKIPIVVLTGLSDDEIGLQAVQAGAQDYLVKGWSDGSIVMRALKYAIERHRLLEEISFKANLLRTLPHSVISTNLDHEIVTWNEKSEEILGWVADEALGKDIALIHPR